MSLEQATASIADAADRRRRQGRLREPLESACDDGQDDSHVESMHIPMDACGGSEVSPSAEQRQAAYSMDLMTLAPVGTSVVALPTPDLDSKESKASALPSLDSLFAPSSAALVEADDRRLGVSPETGRQPSSTTVPPVTNPLDTLFTEGGDTGISKPDRDEGMVLRGGPEIYPEPSHTRAPRRFIAPQLGGHQHDVSIPERAGEVDDSEARLISERAGEVDGSDARQISARGGEVDGSDARLISARGGEVDDSIDNYLATHDGEQEYRPKFGRRAVS